MVKNNQDEEYNFDSEVEKDDDEITEEEMEAETQAFAQSTSERRGRPKKVIVPEDEEDEFGHPVPKQPQTQEMNSRLRGRPMKNVEKAEPKRPQNRPVNQSVKPQASPTGQAEVPKQFRYCVPFSKPAESGFVDPETGEILADDMSMMIARMYNKICEIEEKIASI